MSNKKIKISIDRPEVSSEEIASRRNYESVLAMAGAVSVPFFKKPWFWSLSLVTVVALVTVLVMNSRKEKSPAITNNTSSEQVINKQENNATSHLKEETEVSQNVSIPPVLSDIDTPSVSSRHKQNYVIKPGIAFSTYKINAQKGGSFTHHSGSIVTFPANSFIDKNGKRVIGEVEIRYREYRDAYDILIGGITMKYDSAGKHHDLESAGMMEIRGYQNGVPVEVAPGRSISVKLASDISDPGYNLYQLNEDKNIWEYRGDENVIPAQTSVTVSERETNFSNSMQPLQPDWINQKQGLIGVEYVEPVRPQRINKKNYTFRLTLGEKSSQYLRDWQGMQFEVESSEKQFDSRFYNLIWKNVNVIAGDSNRNYRFMFISGSPADGGDRDYIPNLIFKAYPVFDNDVDSVKAMKRYEKQLVKYEEYQANFEKQQNELLQEQISQNYNGKSYTGSVQNIIYRGFSVLSFGVWNCDQIYRVPNLITKKIKLYKEDGSIIDLNTLQLIDKSVRSVFYYDVAHGGFSTIKFNPNSKVCLVGITTTGEILYVTSDEFSSIVKSQQEMTFNMHLRNNDFKEAEALKDFLKGL